MNILKNKTLLGGAGVIVLAALIYYVWNSAGNSALLTETEGASPLSQEILATLSQLHTIRLDSTIFEDPTFRSLSDFGTTIPPQQAGRRNPFAPIGSAAASGKAPAAQ